MFICAGNNETFDFAVPTGVGLIETAMNLTRLCLFDKPDFLLFVGTAGSYGEFELFDIIESKTAANIELSFLQKQAYTPLDNVESTDADRTGSPVINSSNYITTDAALAGRLLKLGIGAENMEFYSVLRIAREFGIPAGGVFCITNFCNENAHSDFAANHERAKTLLSDFIRQRAEKLLP